MEFFTSPDGFLSYLKLAFSSLTFLSAGLYWLVILVLYSKKVFSLKDIIYIISAMFTSAIFLNWHGKRSYSYLISIIVAVGTVAIIGVLRKIKLFGFGFFFLGALLNCLVIMVNGLQMPVIAGYYDQLPYGYVEMSDLTSLNYLGDWIPSPTGHFSPGDFLMWVSSFVAFAEAVLWCGQKRGE